MKIIPSGKGWFIWQIKRVRGGDPTVIANKAKEQGVSWVSIKVNDGYSDYNLRPALLGLIYVDDIVQPLVDAFRAQGIKIFGWGYIYLSSPVKEAQKSAERVNRFNLDGYMVDGESQWSNKTNEATSYMSTLRAALPDTSIGMCSYRFPSVHADFPWAAALKYSDYHCPQVYWAKSHNSAEQLAQSVHELTAKKNIPVVPLGYAYQYEYDSSKPTEAEIQAFHAKAQELDLPGEGWYEWGDAINAGLDNFVAALQWGDVVMPPPEPPPGPYYDVTLKLDPEPYVVTHAEIGINGYTSFITFTPAPVVDPPPVVTPPIAQNLYRVAAERWPELHDGQARPRDGGPLTQVASSSTKGGKVTLPLGTAAQAYIMSLNNAVGWGKITADNFGPSQGMNDNGKLQWQYLIWPGNNMVNVLEIAGGWARIETLTSITMPWTPSTHPWLFHKVCDASGNPVIAGGAPIICPLFSPASWVPLRALVRL